MGTMPTSGRWEELALTGDLSVKVRQLVLDIAAALYTPANDLGPSRSPAAPVDFADGSAGTAAFFTYLARASQVDASLGSFEAWTEVAQDHLEHAIEGIAEFPMGPGLFSGLSGSAWAIVHLGAELLDESALDPGDREAHREFLDQIDTVLLQHVEQAGATLGFDVVSGLAGIGLYALERRAAAEGHTLLDAVMERLAATAERDSDGVTWSTIAPTVLSEDEVPEQRNDLGLAHGLPGVIGFLAGYLQLNAESELAKDLLRGAVSWLLAHSLEPLGHPGFPAVHVPNVRPGPARAAWCYGDPGVASVLYLAGQGVQEQAWTAAALDLAVDCAVRSTKQSAVQDACLCHGSAGLMHMFNRLYQASKEPSLRCAALRWLDWTLGFRVRDAGGSVAGFRAYTLEEGKPVWVAERGFLNGAAGIGLALLAMISQVEPRWDRFLVLSV